MSIVIDYTKGFFEASPAGETVGDISGSASLDLSSGNVFSYTPAANTTFVFSNPPASGTALGFTLKITGADVLVGYDLANASSDSKTFSVASEEVYSQGLTFNSNGTKMYIVGSASDSVFQYTLSTPWDVSTASYDSVSLSGFYNPRAVAFNNDGSKLYVLSGSDLQEFPLSTPFDISTAGSFIFTSFDTENVGGHDIAFNNDGTKLYYVADSSNIAVYQYTLSTPFDISTKSYDNVSFDLSTQILSATALEISSDGSSMLVTGRPHTTIFEYTLSTPFDISTMSYSGISFNVFGADNTPWGMTVGDSGAKMYILGGQKNTVTQYSISTSSIATFAYPASVDWAGGTAPDAPATGETDVLVFYTQDGGTTYYGFQAGDAMA